MKASMRSLSSVVIALTIAGCPKAKAERPEDNNGSQIPDEKGEVTFADANLEFYVRLATGKREGPILKSDLRGLTELHVRYKWVTELSGAQHCTNLHVLKLDMNRASDLTPLGTLRQLRELRFRYSRMSDISPLRAPIHKFGDVFFL